MEILMQEKLSTPAHYPILPRFVTKSDNASTLTSSHDEHIKPFPDTVVDPALVTWDGPKDPENPLNWTRSYKWLLTIVCSIMSISV
jgi:hypothetical protein